MASMRKVGRGLLQHQWLVAAAGAAGVALVAAAAQAGGEEDSTRSAHDVFVDQSRQGVPVVVPDEMPEGYEFWGMPGVQTSGTRVISAQWQYRPLNGPGTLPVVQVCLEPFDDMTPCGDDAFLLREVDGVRVKLTAMGPGPDEPAQDLWSDVDLTSEWRSVEWIQANVVAD